MVLKRKWLLEKWPFGHNNDFQRFVILCHPRTGSTWLHTLLNSNTRVMSYGEILTEKKSMTKLEEAIWSDHHSFIQAVGCKIFYEQLGDEQFCHVLGEIASNPNIKIIDLSRKDSRAAFSSLKIAKKSGTWSSTRNNQNKGNSVFIAEKESDSYTENLELNRARVLHELKFHEVFSLSYEDLVRNEGREMDRVQNFLNVTPVSLFSLLRKQADV
ncbi:sulfotransferase domain-containing protein [Reichenbachiella sp.]|uniref:sulfotransferase domain-containing protein n=1 Tax=Reichenbachiella sp. TaxID=2184521 RepID=UPI003BAF5CCE